MSTTLNSKYLSTFFKENLKKLTKNMKKEWQSMGCVTSKVPDIVGEGYHLKVRKTVAVGGSAKVFSDIF